MFTLKIELGNDSMRTCNDVYLALSKIASRLRGRDWESWEEIICDDNGLKVGEWAIEGAVSGEDED